MESKKLNVFLAFYPYGGNGGVACETPDIRRWIQRALPFLSSDARIGRVDSEDFSDTPIDMTRNRSIAHARACGSDVIVMCDSDMSPDKELLEGDSAARPWLESSFDFLYARHEQGPVAVFAPYCGPPPNEEVYIFTWRQGESHTDSEVGFSLEMLKREEAAVRTGFEAIAAGPTGLCMWDLRCFDQVEPPYFHYEWPDDFHADKASTEDVVATRNVSLAGCSKLGYNPLFVNWDAWAGHWKPKCVRKPRIITATDVARRFERAGTRLPENVLRVRAPIADELKRALNAAPADGKLLRMSRAEGDAMLARANGSPHQE